MSAKLKIAAAAFWLAAGPVAAQEQSNEPPLADSPAGAAIATAPSRIVDFGSLIRGNANAPNAAMSKNGGQPPARECPSCGQPPGGYGALTIGPGGVNNFDWQINDAGPSMTYPSAPGVAGPQPNTNNQVSGWSLLQVVQRPPPFSTTGNLTWTATSAAGSQFTFALETLLGPETTVGTSPDGAMADFDKNLPYSWPFIAYSGTYTGPLDSATLTADTLIDTSLFANAIPPTARFSIALDPVNKQMDLIYTPVPEPGTLGLVTVGLLGVWYRSRRRIVI